MSDQLPGRPASQQSHQNKYERHPPNQHAQYGQRVEKDEEHYEAFDRVLPIFQKSNQAWFTGRVNDIYVGACLYGLKKINQAQERHYAQDHLGPRGGFQDPVIRRADIEARPGE